MGLKKYNTGRKEQITFKKKSFKTRNPPFNKVRSTNELCPFMKGLHS